jgi:hypothetical protein
MKFPSQNKQTVYRNSCGDVVFGLVRPKAQRILPKFVTLPGLFKLRDSSVGTAAGYWLDDRGVGV